MINPPNDEPNEPKKPDPNIDEPGREDEPEREPMKTPGRGEPGKIEPDREPTKQPGGEERPM